MSSWFTNNRDPAKTMETTVLIAPSYWQRDPRWWLSSLSIEGSPRKCQPIRRPGQRQLKHNNNFLLSATGILTSIGDCACVVIPYGVVLSVSGSSVRLVAVACTYSGGGCVPFHLEIQSQSSANINQLPRLVSFNSVTQMSLDKSPLVVVVT